MGENVEEKNQNQKKDEGVKSILIILIVLVLVLIGLTGYKMFSDKAEKTNNNNNVEERNEEKEQVEQKEKQSVVGEAKEVPLKDTFAQSINADSNYLNTYTYILKNGKVFESKNETRFDNKNTSYVNYSTAWTDDLYNRDTISFTEVKNLPSIKRIKGFVITESGEHLSLLLVSEEGEVYIYYITANGDVKKAPFLDDYKVEDIISYYAAPNCTVSHGETVKTCGGEYNIIDKEGNQHHYVVNKDGSLTKK